MSDEYLVAKCRNSPIGWDLDQIRNKLHVETKWKYDLDSYLVSCSYLTGEQDNENVNKENVFVFLFYPHFMSEPSLMRNISYKIKYTGWKHSV